ncbi:MAG: molybdate ABC transporter substrate-binding protein [Proteobacteria bacterium]|nr:molybdate ABC transporter substrate-binding protein [Pseudomonadota bacterium]
MIQERANTGTSPLRLTPWLGWLLLAALATGIYPAHAQQPERLIVFAAASATEAVQAVAAAFVAANPGVEVIPSFAASSTLARQIRNGAPANLFLSANPDWMDILERDGLLGPRADLLHNRVVLVALATSTLEIELAPGFALAAALGDGRLAIGDPDHVPAGVYGRAALQSMGVWDQVAARTARTTDVRAALALVARGEAPIGIIYATDAAISRHVRVVGMFPESAHPPIVYPLAIVQSGDSDGARALFAFLRSDDAAAIFRRFGFANTGE